MMHSGRYLIDVLKEMLIVFIDTLTMRTTVRVQIMREFSAHAHPTVNMQCDSSNLSVYSIIAPSPY